jgi:hypothetical protein
LTAGPGGRAAIIRWIRSDEFPLWSDLDPEALIEQLQKIKRKGAKKLHPAFEE